MLSGSTNAVPQQIDNGVEMFNQKEKQMNQEVRNTLEQLKAKLYPQTKPTEKQMNQPTPASIPTADLFKQMSVSKATAHCLSINIKKPSAIHKLTGKPIDQIYTALWAIRNKGKKAKEKAPQIKTHFSTSNKPVTTEQVKKKYSTDLMQGLSKAHQRIIELEAENQKLRTVIEYLESR